ncbi:MAG: glutamate-cysteine ligase family protein [Candidatus Bathyarchaeia archaeon]
MRMYQTLEVLGPEHEFAIVDEDLRPIPIADKVIKAVKGRIVNQASLDGSSIGKELQLHVLEFKANEPFSSPETFENTMQKSVDKTNKLLSSNFDAMLLGTGMHPHLHPAEARVWPHRDQKIYNALHQIFGLRQHGWVNIQSFQLNLPYKTEDEGLRLHNYLANLIPYLPALTASSPIYESRIGNYVDNRLYFYASNQKQIPSIAGDIVPEYINSFDEYHEKVIGKYSADLEKFGAPRLLLNKEWVNSRGAIIRFDRRTIEIRVMDEQECVKIDVAISCFIRCILRAWMSKYIILRPHEELVRDLWSIARKGLRAEVCRGSNLTARDICLEHLEQAETSATVEEKRYLEIVENRIREGNLADRILRDITGAIGVRNFRSAVLEVYLRLAKCLRDNIPYS